MSTIATQRAHFGTFFTGLVAVRPSLGPGGPGPGPGPPSSGIGFPSLSNFNGIALLFSSSMGLPSFVT